MEVTNHLFVGVTRGEHGGETRNFFFATALLAGLFEAPVGAHDLERAFAVDFFLQPTQRTFHGFAFFQFNLCQCTHFLSGGGKETARAVPALVKTNGKNNFWQVYVNV